MKDGYVVGKIQDLINSHIPVKSCICTEDKMLLHIGELNEEILNLKKSLQEIHLLSGIATKHGLKQIHEISGGWI